MRTLGELLPLMKSMAERLAALDAAADPTSADELAVWKRELEQAAALCREVEQAAAAELPPSIPDDPGEKVLRDRIDRLRQVAAAGLVEIGKRMARLRNVQTLLRTSQKPNQN